jgi:iron complex transport system substrate-binding protein
VPLYLIGYNRSIKENSMLRRSFLVLFLLTAGTVRAADVTDATGRTVRVPDGVAHVLPAGPPAAVLLEAVAPDLMVGWSAPLSKDAGSLLPTAAVSLPQVPRLTGQTDVTPRIQALKPDLILDYGDVSPRYVLLARTTQLKTGIPTILLDGSLASIPQVLRSLGGILHREGRAETLATLAEAMVSLPMSQATHPRVLYARGANGLTSRRPAPT